MISQYYLNLLKVNSKALFDRGFIGLYHGAISAKNTHQSFIINTRESFFNSLDKSSLIELDFNESKIWEMASNESKIHANIYKKLPSAKYVSSIFSSNIVAVSLIYEDCINPIDYYGKTIYGEIPIYDPRQFHDWHERAPHELPLYFQKNNVDFVIVKGIGLYCFKRDIHDMIRSIAILNKTSEILLKCRNVNN